MSWARSRHHQLQTLTDLPNVGPAMAAALQSLGYRAPADLDGCDAFEQYQRLSQQRGCRQDPRVLDVFLSIQRFLAGEHPQPWWAYSAVLRQALPRQVRVWRDGQLVELTADVLVPGDRIALEEGDSIPADAPQPRHPADA
ncbi:MAG: helix-hairpin-helix domain-containing protein [Prochlorococcaceae cyanobacterium]